MHELISHPGLQFYVLRLSGTLHYTLTILGRAPKAFELSGADFEGVDLAVKEEGFQDIQGTSASAVGIELKLVRNSGLLELRYEGLHGGTAEWNYEGLQAQEKITGTAGTQTEDAKMVDAGVQTDQAARVQITYTPQNVANLGDTATSQTHLKENARDKFALVPKDIWSDSSPRHLYMESLRLPTAESRLSSGHLHIDRKMGKVYWLEDLPMGDGRFQERKVNYTIDLRFKELLVESVFESGSAASCIKIWRKDGAGRIIISFKVSVLKEIVTMWASDIESTSSKSAATSFYDPDVIVEEIKLCIDKTTGRQCSVPSPKINTLFNPFAKRKPQDEAAERGEKKRCTKAESAAAPGVRKLHQLAEAYSVNSSSPKDEHADLPVTQRQASRGRGGGSRGSPRTRGGGRGISFDFLDADRGWKTTDSTA